MNERRKDGAYSDFTINASGKSFPVHRVVFDAASEYFRAMLSRGMKESGQGYCEFHEDPAIVDQCIEFMYTKKMELRVETVANILKLSHQWLLDGADTACVEFMQKHVSPQNCVEWINISSMYDLRNLESTCVAFLLRNIPKVNNIQELGIQTLTTVVSKVQTRPEQAKVMWNIIALRMQQPGCDSPCQLVQTFRAEKLSKAEFQSSVLKNKHVSSCNSCDEYVTKRRYVHTLKSGDINIDNCLAVSDLAARYEATEVIQILEKYISKHFSRVCTKKEFLTLVRVDQLLTYICRIHRDCTKPEFRRIIAWIQAKPEREAFFPRIFSSTKDSVSSRFKNCLHTVEQTDALCELFDLSNCCFLRSLAGKYGCQQIVDATDAFILHNFESISFCDDIALLSIETMVRFTGTEPLYSLNEGLTMWKAVRLWVQKGGKTNIGNFQRLFHSLLFDKFASKPLKIINTDPLVKTSVECMAKLVEVGLLRISQNRCYQDTYNKNINACIAACNTKLQELVDRWNLQDAENRVKWQGLEMRTKAEANQVMQVRQALMEQSDIKGSFIALKDQLDESIEHWKSDVTKLRMENLEMQRRVENCNRQWNEKYDKLKQDNANMQRSIAYLKDQLVVVRREVSTYAKDRKGRNNSQISVSEMKQKLSKIEEEKAIERTICGILVAAGIIFICFRR